MTTRVTVRLSAADAGVRLDRLLRKLLPAMPLSAIHRMIRKGGALVDGARARERMRPEEGAELSLALGKADAAAFRKLLASGASPDAQALPGERGKALNIPILHEDAHVLAFDKPAGIAAHPGSGHHLEGTVLGALYGHVGRGAATFTPALVGRLDRDTSGVQLAGVGPEGLRGLSALSRAGEIAKVYLALVRRSEDGDLPGEGRIDAALVDTKRGGARMRVLPGEDDDADGLEAVTEFRVLARGHGACLVEVRPQTGRRHQIRAHFRSIGAPLAGDPRYGDAKWNRELARRVSLRRLFLHCSEASFEHPVTAAALRIRSELPPDLRRTLRLLSISL